MGKNRWLWWIVLAVAGLLAATVIVGYFVSRSSRTIDAVTVLPSDAEVAEDTDITFRRSIVGSVRHLDTARWGLETEFQLHDGLERWRPVTVLTRTVAGAADVPSVLVELERTNSGMVLHIRQGEIVLRLGRQNGAWVDSTSPSRVVVPVNGRHPTSQKTTLRLFPGDYLGLQGTDLRIGKFQKLMPASLKFTTRRLCPLRGMAKVIPWRPTENDRRACREGTLQGDAQLVLRGSFGLTKPTLKLVPSEGEPGVLQESAIASGKDTVVIALAPATDLMAEVEQIVAYLNAPVAARPYPRTHFEHSVANVDSMVRSITDAAKQVTSTVRTADAALRSPDGLAPVLLGEGSSESLREALAGAANLSSRLADPTGTLVQNVGLEPALSSTTRSIARADSTVQLIRQQVTRLGPRAELAVDQVTSSMEGVQATLQSLKTTGEDVTALKQTVTSKPVVVGIIGLLAASLAANIKWLAW